MRTAPVSVDASFGAAIAFDGPVRALAEALSTLNPLRASHYAVGELLRRTSIQGSDLLPFVTRDAQRYTRNRLFENGDFELLALCWPAGSRSSIHDHGGSRCFVRVIDGSLTSEEFAIVEGGREPGPARLRLTRTQTLNTGDVDKRSPARDIHRVSACDGPAISLHVYANPLQAFLTYDTDSETSRRVLSRNDP